jgi:hypothetical protein
MRDEPGAPPAARLTSVGRILRAASLDGEGGVQGVNAAVMAWVFAARPWSVLLRRLRILVELMHRGERHRADDQPTGRRSQQRSADLGP